MQESPPSLQALQSGCCVLTCEKYVSLPSPMCNTSAVLYNKKVHVIADIIIDNDILGYVISYDITTKHWNRPQSPGMLKVYCK